VGAGCGYWRLWVHSLIFVLSTGLSESRKEVRGGRFGGEGERGISRMGRGQALCAASCSSLNM
jgi:hypothetical protein